MHSRTQVRELTDPERESVRAAFERIERRLAEEDPELMARVTAIPRGEVAHAATIFVLLLLSVILLAIGVGAPSGAALFAGAATFLASFGVDRRFRLRAQRTMAGGQPDRTEA